MELRYLEYFKMAAELQHVSKAADALHIAQPALSRIIHNMETELGVPLFDRNGKKIALNSNGQLVYRYACQIFDALDEMQKEINAKRQVSNSTISISFNSASLVIPTLISDFREEHPDIHIVFSSSGDNNNETSFYIDSYFEERNEAQFTPLMREEMRLAISKDHPLAALDTIPRTALDHETFLYSKECHSVLQATRQMCDRLSIVPKEYMLCVSSETVMSFLEQGFGVALMPSMTWNLVNHPNIVLRDAPGGPYYRTLYLEEKMPEESFPQMRVFHDYAVEFFSEVASLTGQFDPRQNSLAAVLAQRRSQGVTA